MNLNIPKVNEPINFDNICKIVIEDKLCFYEILKEINDNINSNIETIGLYKDDKISLKKQAMFISNYFDISLNDKTILQRLYKQIGKNAVSDENFLSYQELNIAFQKYLGDLLFNNDYDLENDLEIDIISLLKLANVKFIENNNKLYDKLIAYFKNIRNLLSIDIFFMVNLSEYLSIKEIDNLKKFAEYEEFCIIILESFDNNNINLQTRILDKDLCLIYK